MITVTKFSSKTCGPCKALAPVFRELEDMTPEATFISVDVEDKPSIAQLYSIRTVPTIIIEKNNTTVNRMVGLQSKQKYIDAINHVITEGV
jgi:thioredoxin 1